MSCRQQNQSEKRETREANEGFARSYPSRVYVNVESRKEQSLFLALMGTVITLCDRNCADRRRLLFSSSPLLSSSVFVVACKKTMDATTSTSALDMSKEEEKEKQEKEEQAPIHPLLKGGLARFRPDGSLSTSYRSIEHVLKSNSCNTNRHLYRLVNGKEEWSERFLRLVVQDERCANLACLKSLKKELVESVSMIERVEEIVAKLVKSNDIDASTSTGRGIVLLDLCSGKGVAGTMLAVRFPEAQVVGVDIRPPNATERHLDDGLLPNLTRKTGNVYDDKLLEDLIGAQQEDTVCLLLGTHLCGDLSRVAIDLMAQYPQRIAAAVIAPCCLMRQKAPTGSMSFSGKSWGYDTTQLARQKGMDPFTLWLDRLFERAQVQDKALLRDKDMLSSKNMYLLLCRSSQVKDENPKEEQQQQQLCREVNSCSEMVAEIRL